MSRQARATRRFAGNAFKSVEPSEAELLVVVPARWSSWRFAPECSGRRPPRRARGGQHEELYNLKEDIGETRNLADTEPRKRANLSVKLTAWLEEIEAAIPKPNTDYVPWEGHEPSGHVTVE